MAKVLAPIAIPINNRGAGAVLASPFTPSSEKMLGEAWKEMKLKLEQTHIQPKSPTGRAPSPTAPRVKVDIFSYAAVKAYLSIKAKATCLVDLSEADIDEIATKLTKPQQNGFSVLAMLYLSLRLPKQQILKLTQLVFYDLVLFLDTSGSMALPVSGGSSVSRRQELIGIVHLIARISVMLDQNGIDIIFMNETSKKSYNTRNLTNWTHISTILSDYYSHCGGWTPFSTALQHKIVDPFIWGPLGSWGSGVGGTRFEKPLLVLAFTDGMASKEELIIGTHVTENPEHVMTTLHNKLRQKANELFLDAAHATALAQACRLQIAQVGEDPQIHDYLKRLDEHLQVGHLIDTTITDPALMDVGKRVFQILLGAIDPDVDVRNSNS